LVAINKADIDPDAATRARLQIMSSLRLLGLHGDPDHAHHEQAVWQPQVIQISALKSLGVDTFWSSVTEFRTTQTANGKLAARRQHQAKAWMWERIDAGLKQRFRNHAQVREQLADTTAAVLAGEVPASTAARALLDLFD
jgi:LAO/AO transport system kinase